MIASNMFNFEIQKKFESERLFVVKMKLADELIINFNYCNFKERFSVFYLHNLSITSNL